jgi:hypothetical protein
MESKGYYITQGIMIVILTLISLAAAGCDVIGGIFKAGMWTAVVLIALVAGGIFLLVRMFKS